MEKSKTRSQPHPPEDTDKTLTQLQCGEEIRALLENSQNQKQFVVGAKKIWAKFRTSKGKVRRGRPSEWQTVIAEVKSWYDEQNKDFIFEKTTDYQLIQHVESKHPKLHKDTIRKYVKLWRLSWTPPWSRSIADWQWLNKHEPGLVQNDFETIKNLQESSSLSFLLREAEQRISAALKPR
ncbi:MAG: hypothetical protein MRJ68_20590 [Nitrospira sp.]|nr:hypothetical protein [Nitrospira sp.]